MFLPFVNISYPIFNLIFSSDPPPLSFIFFRLAPPFQVNFFRVPPPQILPAPPLSQKNERSLMLDHLVLLRKFK